MFVCIPQSSSRGRFASRTRVPRRGLLRNALGPTARHSCGARSAPDTKHVHPIQQNGFAPDVRAGASNGAYQRASAAYLGSQSRLARRHERLPRRASKGTTGPVRGLPSPPLPFRDFGD